jgi:hypothetical protein
VANHSSEAIHLHYDQNICSELGSAPGSSVSANLLRIQDAVKVLRRRQAAKTAQMPISYLSQESPFVPHLQVQGKPHLEGMAQWLRQLGHEVSKTEKK